jgi:hypothetical protein
MATLRRNESENGTERERGFALGCSAKLDSSGIVLQWNGKVEEDVAFYISRGRSGEVEDVVVS